MDGGQRALWLGLAASGLVAASGLGAAPVRAQVTGGSFGGGEWDEAGDGTSAPSPSGGGGSGGYWGGSSGSGSSAGSGGSSDPPRDDPWARPPRSGGEPTDPRVQVALLVLMGSGFLAFVLVTAFRGWRERRRLAADVSVSVYSVGIDTGARRAVQGVLRDLAEAIDTRDATGRRDSMATVAAAVWAKSEGWAYVGGRAGEPEAKGLAQVTFLEIATDLRSRFRHETVRAAGEAVGPSAPAGLTARPEEGEGFCVVSMVVASRGELPAPGERRDPMVQALDGLDAVTAGELVAFEVIWSPSEERDRMSSAELEVLYPELHRLEGAVAGRVHCRYCGAAFARELERCPGCSAPAQEPVGG